MNFNANIHIFGKPYLYYLFPTPPPILEIPELELRKYAFLPYIQSALITTLLTLNKT